jgi:hypothetical protein
MPTSLLVIVELTESFTRRPTLLSTALHAGMPPVQLNQQAVYQQQSSLPQAYGTKHPLAGWIDLTKRNEMVLL